MGTSDTQNYEPSQQQQQTNAQPSDVCYLPSAPQQSAAPPPMYSYVVPPPQLPPPQLPPPPPYTIQTMPHMQMYSSPPIFITQGALPGQGIMIANNFIPAQAALIKDYMVWSIINIFLGGLILGMIAVLLSSQTRKRKLAGDLHGAKTMSTVTLIFNIIATISFFLLTAFLIVYYILVLSVLEDYY